MNQQPSFSSSQLSEKSNDMNQQGLQNMSHYNQSKLFKQSNCKNTNILAPIFKKNNYDLSDNRQHQDQYYQQQDFQENDAPFDLQSGNKASCLIKKSHFDPKNNYRSKQVTGFQYRQNQSQNYPKQSDMRGLFAQKDKKIIQKVQSDKSAEVRQYFKSIVSPTFQPLIFNLAKYRPQDILSYCMKWFKDKKLKDDSESEEEMQEDGQYKYSSIQTQQFQKYRRQRINNCLRKRRHGVCSQVSGPYNKRKEFILKGGSKKEQQAHLRILFFISNSFLFKNFSQGQINSLVESMAEKDTTQDQLIINQGESGDSMYIVDSGYFECFQNVQGTQQPRILKHYLPGDTFGQLLLLHNSKRSASIISKKPGKLYSLSRQVYKHYKKMSIITKKILYVNVLKKIELFRNFSLDQYQRICDVMTEVVFDAGKFVIIEGDIGNKFYIILEGVAVALKGTDEKIIQCYKEGDYFGQLALLNDSPRSASVKCLTKSTLVYLTQNVFKRIVDKNKIEDNYDQKYRRKPVYIRRRND